MTSLKQQVIRAGNNAGVQGLVKKLFNVELTPVQAEMVEAIAFEQDRRIIFNTYTQFGKTMVVGIGLAFLILRYNDRELHIGSLGPTFGDAEGPRKEMLEKGLNCELFADMIDTSRGNDPEDLKTSASKDLLTFNDGDIKFEVMSASSGSSGKGEGLMGEGVDILVMDESNRIPHTVWMDSADRLLNEYDATLVEMGNPKHQNNQFFEHWQNSKFRKFHVGEKKLHEYSDAYVPDNLTTASGIEEGRHQEKFFDEKAENVGGRDTVRFSWKYKSVFPDQVEGGLISKAWIREAQDKQFDLENPEVKYSIDVADEGDDLIVLTRLEYEDGKYRLTDQWSKKHSNDTRRTAEWANNLVKEKGDKGGVKHFIVDYTGIGAGVWSSLKDLGYNTVKFKAGENPTAEGDKYLNKKARNYFKIRDILQDGDLELVSGFENRDKSMPENKLVYQLGHMKREPARRDKDKVLDPDDKSPDFSDSLMMAVYEPNTGFVL